MEEFDIWEMIKQSKDNGVTFIFDKDGLIITSRTVDSTTIVPEEKTFARRFETDLLVNLDIDIEELVELFLKDRDRYLRRP